MTADDVKRVLGLEPHPCEGGWFRRTYTSALVLPAQVYADEGVGVRYDGPREVSSAIYYLLEPGTFSEMHRLGSDEMFHHYAGGAVEMLQLWPDGRVMRVVLGKDLPAGQRPQVMVPRGVWQGSRMLPPQRTGSPGTPGRGGVDDWALLGCTVSPGFAYPDYEAGARAELAASYPEAEAMIDALTRG